MPLTARATAGAHRYDAVNVTEGESPSNNPAGSPPRKPNTAWLGSPATSASSAPAASTRTSRAACGSSCWASSISNTRTRARSAASSSGSTANASRAAPTSSAAPSAGVVACGAAVPDRGPQQHHLLVLPRELTGGGPLRSPRPAAEPLQLLGVDTAFGAARQQVSQLGGEPRGGQGRPQMRSATSRRHPARPRGRRPAVPG